ncbi:MAG TPA: outer membrane protein assembly factor BamD [Verrucomicrobiae bacterium]
MHYRFIRLVLIAACLLAFPFRAPAPLVYRPGEGWTYEPVGSGGRWQRPRAKEQLEVAQAAFDRKAYGLALKAARHVLVRWPESDYAPQAQNLVARSYEAKGDAEKAFKEYQKLLEKQPKTASFDEIRRRQYEIANLFLAGKRFKLWGTIPLYRSMDRTAKMYKDIVKTGPYSDVAPQAQLNIGAAREKQSSLGFKAPDYTAAIQAYDLAADRYHDQPKVASEAIYRAGLAYQKQAQSPDRDQGAAGQAIAKFTDFLALYPDDPRAPQAHQIIASLKSKQAQGNFVVAQFYEKRKRWEGARIYYNEVLLQDPNSPYAPEARKRIDQLKQRTQGAGK